MFSKVIYCLFILIINISFLSAKTLPELEKEIKSIKDDKALIILSSYKGDIENWSQEDQGRYYTLRGLKLENSNLDLAEQNYNKAIELLEGLDFISENLINALIERSYIYYLKTNDTNDYCPDRLKALELARKSNDYKKALARSLVQYSFCYDGKQEHFPKALKLLEEAIQISEDYNLNSPLIYNATAILYRSNNIYEKSYDYFIKAYQGWEKLNDIQDMFNMQHSLLNISLKMGDFQKAKEHEKVLFKLTEENSDFSDFSFFTYFNSGMISFQENDFSKSVENFEHMLKLQNSTNEKYYVRLGLSYLAISNFRLENIDLAKNQATKFISMNVGSNTLKISDLMMGMIIDYTENKNWHAINKMWKHIDLIEKDKRNFLINSSKAQSLVFDRSLNKFENKILAQEISINNLLLTSEKRKNKIAELTIFSIAVFSLAILIFTVSLWRSKKKFVRLSQIDFLTKISNRRHIFETGQTLIDDSISNGQSLTLFIFDIDDFKSVNDNYGHDAGDNTLKQITKICRNILPEKSLFGRFGGEEFIYLIPDISHDLARAVAEQVRQGVSNISLIEKNQSFHVTISTGISSSNQTVLMSDLVKQADMALYDAKNNGKNKVIVYKG